MRLALLATLLGCQLAPALAQSEKEFTAEDLLSAPRPQRPIPNSHGDQAISIVDRWDPKADK